jgi:pimeloyl-ACP methyl ester carboxylesterase
MPVWVKGNIDSGVFIIFNHGGPGSCGTLESIIEVNPGNGKMDHPSPLQILEKDFAMVYWDQRHSGMSKGSADPNDSRPEDFGNDLAVVIQELQNRYTIKKIFLIGQSWGHFVATSYMTYVENWKENQSNITGYIGYKGNHNHHATYTVVRPKIIAHAQKEIQEKRDIAYWREVVNFYQSNTALTNIFNYQKHSGYIYSIMGATISLYDRVIASVKASLFSPFNGLPLYPNIKKTQQAQKMFSWVISDSSISDIIHRINIPTLLIYGQNDLVAPVEVGQIIYDEIETAEQDKELLVLNNSRHGAENEDVLIFQKAIKSFIDRYR